MRLGRTILPLFLLFATGAMAQNSKNVEKPTSYLTFDASQSLEGNEMHDKMQFFIQNSSSIELSEDLQNLLDGIQDDPQLHAKLNHKRETILKILENPLIQIQDKKAIFTHIIQTNDQDFAPIISVLQTYVNTH